MTRYQNMWQTEDVERALKRYNTDKAKLDADAVNFQPIDDMDIGDHYLVSYFLPSIIPVSEILWIRFVEVFGRINMWTLISDGYTQLLPFNDEKNTEAVVQMLCKRNKNLIYGENKELKELFNKDFKQFCNFIKLHPNENAADIKVDPALLSASESKETEPSAETVKSTEKQSQPYIPPKKQESDPAAVSESPRLSLSEDFMVTDKESARTFFMACEGSCNIMKEHFSENVYEAFKSTMDHQTYYEFTKEFALKKFNSLLNDEEEYIPSVVSQVFDVAQYWGMDFYDDEIIAGLTAVAELSNYRSPNVERLGRGYPIQFQHDTWLKKYLEKYINRSGEIQKIKPLADMTFDYLSKKYQNNDEYSVSEIIELCITLKGLVLEASVPEKSTDMHFALTEDKETDCILDEFSLVCSGNAGYIKEMIHSLNCIYGIRTSEFFITAASKAVDSGSIHSWDIYRFAAVFYHENSVALFECKRNNDGLFYPDDSSLEKYPILKKYQDNIAQAIVLYRNPGASEKFIKDLEKEDPEFSCYNAGSDKQTELCKRFGESFAYLRERIHGQSISDILTELIDCCEEVSPMIGIEQTEFNDPATDQEIAECEKRIGFVLPVPVKEFLQFSNGASLFDSCTTIWSTSEIGKFTLDGYDDENAETYLPVGDFIGDGTQFVINKETGAIAQWDHETGDVMEYGDFEEFLAEIIEFHCGDYLD